MCPAVGLLYSPARFRSVIPKFLLSPLGSNYFYSSTYQQERHPTAIALQVARIGLHYSVDVTAMSRKDIYKVLARLERPIERTFDQTAEAEVAEKSQRPPKTGSYREKKI